MAGLGSLNNIDDWRKKAGELYRKPMGEAGNYVDDFMARHGLLPEQAVNYEETKDNGWLGWAKDAIDAGAASVLAGQARFGQVNSPLGGDSFKQGAEYLEDVVQRNSRSKFQEPELTNVNYWFDPQGAWYDVNNMLGSMGALGAETAAVVGAASASPLAGAAGAVATKIPAVARLWSSPLGKLVIGNVATTPFEAISEGGNLVGEMLEEGYSEDEIKSAVNKAAGMNVAFLGLSNALQSFGATKLLGLLENPAKVGAKEIVKKGIMGAAGGGITNAGEEAGQSAIGYVAQSKPLDLQDIIASAKAGLVGGLVLGGAGGAAGSAIAGNGRQEKPALKGVGNNVINNVRALQGELPYRAEDGTNCMRTMGIALQGTPFAGQINVDQAVNTAEENGLLRNPENYTPQPGDMAVVEDGNHIVMVTEDGGTIQNGASQNGIYESQQSPAEMFGKVKYYIQSSVYASDSRSATGLQNKSDAVENVYKGAEDYRLDDTAVSNKDSGFSIEQTEKKAGIEDGQTKNSENQNTQFEQIEAGTTKDGEETSASQVEVLNRQEAAKRAASRAQPAEVTDFFSSIAYPNLAKEQAEDNLRSIKRQTTAAGGFMPSEFYTDNGRFRDKQKFRDTIDKLRQQNLDQRWYGMERDKLNSGLEGLERDAADYVTALYPDNPAAGIEIERTRLQRQYDEMLAPVIEELKGGMKQGVEIIRPGGEGMGYRESRNAPWYRDFYKQNKRPPTQAELKQIAYDVLSGQSILPGWQNDSAESAAYFSEAKETLDGLQEQLAALDSIKSKMPERFNAVDETILKEPQLLMPKSNDRAIIKNAEIKPMAEVVHTESGQEFGQSEANTSAIDNEGVDKNVTDSSEKLAAGDGEIISTQNEVRENAGGREPAGRNGQRVRETESGGSEGHLRADRVHDSGASVGRTVDDSRLQKEESADSGDSSGGAGLSRSVSDSFEGQPDVNGKATGRAVKLVENRRSDAAAEIIKNQPNKGLKAESLRRVAKRLPFLTDGQMEDVVFAEKRLQDEAKTGILFTNGTGTGKTFSGLGIAKELAEQGKNNILVVTPNDQINAQWISAAKDYFDLMLTPLESINDAGSGATITTYANMQQNDALVGRSWDLVIADESQNLMNNEKGEATGALQKLRAITFNKRGLYERAKVLLRTDEEKRLDKELDDVTRQLRRDKDNAELDAKREKLQSKLHEMAQAHAESDRQEIEKWRSIADSEKPKTVFLSATPFAYDKDVDYAEGYLFDYPEADGSGYNSGDGREQFMMQHFGYSMRYNKLTRPDAQVDNRVMEVQFHEWLRKEGALSGRQLDIDKDYNRGFLLVGQGVGKNIDEGFNWLQDNHARYSSLRDFLTKQFNGRTRNYMIESIKAREVIPIVKEYLHQGKKVVLFHDTNKPRVLTHPFKISTEIFSRMAPEERSRVLREYEAFKIERPDLVNLNLASLNSPIEILQSAFGDELMLFNGDIPKNKRRENVREFNDDDGQKRLILVQADAGNAGISLHDTTGKHQRVLINLGIPKRPSYAIQIEGRIYRQGSMSNAIIRYLSTGMDVEKRLFAGTIASRASTAENLALGNQARGLRDSFVNAFLETMDGTWEQRKPGADGEDVGGKEYDRATLSPLSDFDRAKSLYFANQKKNAGNKSAEGKDYFATPEPVGFKMVEWAGLNDGDKVLEPSAGHGAISRFFSPNTENVIIEPSGKLAALAQMNTDGAKVINSNFEDYNVVNKFNAVVMNPPFGVGGKTAMDHVAKAFKHLRDNGRIIAIVPDGPSMMKRFERWYDSEEAANAYLVGEVLLPGEAFKRAGTGIFTKILVIDKHMSKDRLNVDSRQIDLRSAKDVNDLFDRIENLSMPERTVQDGSIKAVENKTPAVTAATSMQDSNLFETDIYTHTKTGEKLYRVKIKERVSGDDYKKLSGYAKKYGGYYSRFAKGFLFDEEGSRDSFIDFVNNSSDIKYSISDKGEELNPIALDEWEAQAKDAFPNAKNFSRDGSVMEFDLPNGEHMQINVVDRVVLDDAEFERAQADYGGKLERDAEVLGSVRTIGENAFMTLAQENVRGTIDHEALHYARTHGLTGRENAALERVFKGNEEAMAEAYRKWRIRWKELKEGSDWGKLWRKVKDFAAKVADFLGFETEHDIFRKIESGEVWERNAKDSEASGLKLFSLFSQKEQEKWANYGKVFRKNIQDALESKVRGNKPVKVCDTPLILQELGVPDLPIKMRIGIAANTTKKEGIAEHAHELTLDMLEQIPQALNEPVFVMKSATQPGDIVVFTDIKDAQGRSVIVPLTIQKDIGHGDIANVIKSIYGRNAEDLFVAKQVLEKNLLYANTEKSPEWLEGFRLQLPDGLTKQSSLLEKSISEKLQGVNAGGDAKYSIFAKNDAENRDSKPLTGGKKVARAFSNIERKGTVQSVKDWLADKRKNLYRDWIDKNDALHDVDAAVEKEVGRKLTDDEKIYNKAQTMKANASGTANALIEGDENSIKAVNARLKKKKLPHVATLAMALEKIDRKFMDSKYGDYLKNNGLANWIDALGTYLGSIRLLEMNRLHREAYQQKVDEWEANGARGKKPVYKPYKLPGNLVDNDLREFIRLAPKEFKEAASLYWKFNDNLLTVMEDAGMISAETHELLNTKYKYYAPLMRDFSDTAAADNFIGGLQGVGRGIANISSTLKTISVEGSERGIINPLESSLKAAAVVCARAERNKVGQMAVQMAADGSMGNVVWAVEGKSADPKNCIFTIMENGKKVAYQTIPEFYGPIAGYNEASAGFVLGLARNTARMLRAGATSSPSFIVRNLIRDTFFAGVSSKTGFIPFVDTVRGMYALAKNPQLRAEFEAAGVNQYNFYSSAESVSKSLDEMAGGKAWREYGVGDVWNAFMKYPGMLSEFVESSSRMGEFMRARKQGVSIDEAARYARELTLDFSRSGVQGEKVNQIVPFFNACLQGGDKMIRLMKDDPVETVTALGKYIVLPSVILWALNHDEDWYKELDPNIKNTCWCLPGGIRIPKPQEAGVFFGSGIEMILEMATKTDPEAMGEWAEAFKDAALPNFVPTLILPLFEWKANYSDFRGQPITGKRLERLPDEMQFNPGTSEVAKAVGQVLKVSPVKVDNTIRGYTGTMGMFLAQSLDPLVAEKRNMPTKKFSELTFVRDFMLNDNIKNRSVNDFYDMLDTANKQHAGYGVKGKPVTAVKLVRKAGQLISNANKDIRNITTSTVLSPDEKRARIDKKKAYIKNVARAANAKFGKYFR